MCCLNLADKAQVRVTERLKSMQATQDSPDTRLVGTAKLRQAICRKKHLAALEPFFLSVLLGFQFTASAQETTRNHWTYRT